MLFLQELSADLRFWLHIFRYLNSFIRRGLSICCINISCSNCIKNIFYTIVTNQNDLFHQASGLSCHENTHGHFIISRIYSSDAWMCLEDIGHNIQLLAVIKVRRLLGNNLDVPDPKLFFKAFTTVLGNVCTHNSLNFYNFTRIVNTLSQSIGCCLSGTDGIVTYKSENLASSRRTVKSVYRNVCTVGVISRSNNSVAVNRVEYQCCRFFLNICLCKVKLCLIVIICVLNY